MGSWIRVNKVNPVQTTPAASEESQEGASTLTTTDIPRIVAEVLRQTGVPEIEKTGDHEPVEQGRFQSSSGASPGQYGVVLTSSCVYWYS